MENKKFDIKILVVEDDDPSRFFLSKFVSKISNNTYTAENGKEGLDIYLKEKPQIIITDVAMPQMNGIAMAQKIRKINPEAQIIMTTAFDDKKTLLDAIKIGVHDFIIKPIKKNDLEEAINRVADKILLEQKIQEQYEKIRLLSSAIEQSASIVIITDPAGKIQFANNTFYTVTGFQKSETDNKKVQDFFYNEIESNNYQKYRDAISLKKNWRGELQGFKKYDGTNYWSMTSITPIISKSGDTEHFVQVNEDITDLKQIHKELEEHNIHLDEKVKERTKDLQLLNKSLQDEIEVRKKIETDLIKAKETAETANKAKSNFLAKVSHELRTPMNGIIGMSSFLLDSGLNDKQKYYASVVKKSADSLLLIINDILDISKIEAGKFKIIKENFNPLQIINEAIQIIEPKNKEDVTIGKNISGNVPESVYGDTNRIQQVLLNFLSNAVKFTEKGKILVSLKAETNKNEATLEYSVEDTGIGISEEDQAKLFQMFTQIEQTMTRKHGGTGLGLAISKEIIELMNGKIWFKSIPGKGSKFAFSVSLPLSQNVTEAEEEVEKYEDEKIITAELIQKLQSKKSLIADDSFVNREVLSTILEDLKLSYKEAKNGKEAIELHKENNFDIIFMDLQMPVTDGITAIDEIRKYDKGTAIIVITAHSDKSHKDEAMEHGADDVIVKPFSKDKFIRALHNLFCRDDNDTLDFTSLLKSINYNESVFNRIINYYTEKSAIDILRLKPLCEADDFDGIYKLAHKFKSVSGQIGAKQLYENTKDVEFAAAKKDYEKLKHSINELLTENERIKEYLKNNKSKIIISQYKKD